MIFLLHCNKQHCMINLDSWVAKAWQKSNYACNPADANAVNQCWGIFTEQKKKYSGIQKQGPCSVSKDTIAALDEHYWLHFGLHLQCS